MSLQIATFLNAQCDRLGISRKELVRRCGFKDLSKGLRRYEQLTQGDWKAARGLLQALPAALHVDPSVVDAAVDASKQEIAAEAAEHQARENAWRANFKPHAVIVPERRIPSPIFVAALLGPGAILRIALPEGTDETRAPQDALKGIAARLRRYHPTMDPEKALGAYPLPAFGRPIGFVINYAVDRAVRYDLDGHPLKDLDAAVRIGEASFTFGRN